MPIPAVFDTDEDRSRFTLTSSAVDEAAIEWGYSPLNLACYIQLRRWQPTNVSKVNTLLLKKDLPSLLPWRALPNEPPMAVESSLFFASPTESAVFKVVNCPTQIPSSLSFTSERDVYVCIYKKGRVLVRLLLNYQLPSLRRDRQQISTSSLLKYSCPSPSEIENLRMMGWLTSWNPSRYEGVTGLLEGSCPHTTMSSPMRNPEKISVFLRV
eukprot:scaffold170_cov434-Pavlova_lutheri.AAC.1